jgi:hypothetical protein
VHKRLIVAYDEAPLRMAISIYHLSSKNYSRYTLDTLEGALDVFGGVAKGDGSAVRAGGGMFGFA